MKISMAKALNEALRAEMKANPNVVVFGEDIEIKGVFTVTLGLVKEFGRERVTDTPISEQMIVGVAMGAALTGLVPVVELQFGDFVGCCGDQILNQASKFRYMFGGGVDVPMVLRLPCGAGFQAAAQHSQSMEGWLTHVPGLKVVYPSNPWDAHGLMLTAIRDQNPVVFMEHKKLYSRQVEIQEDFAPIPFGKARMIKEGKDVTVVATGFCVHKSLEVAEELGKEGIDVEIIDPRTLYPLDKEAIFNSVEKTGRLVVVTEETKRGAWSAELASLVAEERFAALKAGVVRVGTLNVPIPFTKNLEEYVIPQTIDIVNAIRKVV